jgi:cbb3-type cytochrome oxidase maturation protein
MLCSIILAGGFLLAFIWASKTGQFEDDISPAHRILFDQNKKLKNK